MPLSAAESLYHCLVELGEQSSNPVLQVLDNTLDILQQKKYPKELLHFNGTGWRAYYHCHTNKDDINHLFDAEHGHFHIFTQLTEHPETWTHVVALSIDEMGQPLRWFMVNHWVTGEKWCDAGTLTTQLQCIAFKEQKTLLERWLLAIVALYKDEIVELLTLRDQSLMFNHSTNNTEENKKNRHYYLLAEQKINLRNKLEQVMSG